MSAYDDLRIGWRLSAADATIHSVKGSCDLTRTGAPSATPGHFGWAVDFTQALTEYYRTVGAGSLNDVSVEFMITAWFRLDTLASVLGADAYIISTNSGANDGLEIYLNTANDKLTARIRNNADAAWVIKSTDLIPDLNTWYFLRVWWDDDDDKIHIALNETHFYESGADTGGAPTSVDGDINIGDNHAGVKCFDGAIQDLYIFDGHLTTAEIEEVHDSGRGRSYPFDPTRLASYYNLCHGALFNWYLDDLPVHAASNGYYDTVRKHDLTPYGSPISRTPLVAGLDRCLSLSGVSQSAYRPASICPSYLRAPWLRNGVCSWRIWATADVLGAVLRYLFACDDGTTGYSLFVSNATEKFTVRIRSAAGVESHSLDPAPIVNHVYHLYMWVNNNASKVGLAIDGGKYSQEWDINDGAFTKAVPSPTAKFVIGARCDNLDLAEWDGGLGPLTVWPYQLTTQQLLDDYNGGRGFKALYAEPGLAFRGRGLKRAPSVDRGYE